MTGKDNKLYLEDCFEYFELNSEFTQKEISEYRQSIIQRYKKLIERWDTELNSEWVLRHYLAVKMILAASIMFTSLDYANKKNLRIVEPYLLYYSLLTCCRAVVFTLPEAAWNNGELMTMNHSKIINLTASNIGILNISKANQIKENLIATLNYRELFSYKFPANGLHSIYSSTINFEMAVKLATLISEVAQFNSQQLQYCICNQYDLEALELDINILKRAFEYEGPYCVFTDREDWYRLNYIIRKRKFPLNLHWTMTEGLVEDFFGAWCPEEAGEDLYNPDESLSIIFPVP